MFVKNKTAIEGLRAEGAKAARSGSKRRAPYAATKSETREWYTGYDQELGRINAQKKDKLNAFVLRVMARVAKIDDSNGS